MKPLLHIGYPKTGSTFLQVNIFKPEYGFYNAYDRYFAEVIERLILCNSFLFDAAENQKFFAAKYKDAIEQGLKPVISAEALSGEIFSDANTEKDISFRVKKTFPDAKILIVVRNQKSIIRSVWRHYMRNNGAQTIERFVRKPGLKTGFSSVISMDRYQYHLFVSHYQRLFGEENVLVLPFELLKISQKKFANKILAFGETETQFNDEIFAPANVTRRSIELYLRNRIGRYMNVDRYGDERMFLQKVLDKICPIVSKITPDTLNASIEKTWDGYLDDLTQGYYKQSNKQLADITGIDLESYGYDL